MSWIPFCIFWYDSHAVVSGTYLWVACISLPRLDGKILSRLAEYDNVIIGPPFQPCLAPPPNQKSITTGCWKLYHLQPALSPPSLPVLTNKQHTFAFAELWSDIEVTWIYPLNGYKYRYTDAKGKWQTTRRLCQNEGGDLVGKRIFEPRLKKFVSCGLLQYAWWLNFVFIAASVRLSHQTRFCAVFFRVYLLNFAGSSFIFIDIGV